MWLRPPKARPIAGSVCVGELAREVHGELARPGQAGGAAVGEHVVQLDPKSWQMRRWISSIERSARPQVGIEAGEHLLGELGGDRRGR